MTRSALWQAILGTGLLHVAVLVVPLHFRTERADPEAPALTLRFETLPPPDVEPEVEEPEPPPEPPPPVEPPPEPPPRERRPKRQAPEPVAAAEPAPQPEPTPPPEPVAAPAVDVPVFDAPQAAVERVSVPPPAPARPSRPASGPPDYGGWAKGVHAAFMKHRHYPPAALRLGLEGVAKVRVRVDRSGRLLGDPELVASSGHDVLDQEALRAARAAAPFEPLPEETPSDEKSFVIPLAFTITSR